MPLGQSSWRQYEPCVDRLCDVTSQKDLVNLVNLKSILRDSQHVLPSRVAPLSHPVRDGSPVLLSRE